MMKLYFHPFSSYSQKALIAFYETGTDFEPMNVDGPPDNPVMQQLGRLWPMKRFPVLALDDGRTILEASCIVEHIAPQLIPADPAAALQARMLDRFFDNYVSTPQQKLVFDAIRPSAADRDAYGCAEARRMLETAYAWLEELLADGRTWATGAAFTLADCAAAPFLFYADWTHPIDPQFARVIAYRQRLLARPSFARAVDEARKYRHYFPLGAPDRD